MQFSSMEQLLYKVRIILHVSQMLLADASGPPHFAPPPTPHHVSPSAGKLSCLFQSTPFFRLIIGDFRYATVQL